MDEETRVVFRDSLLDLANYSIIALALSEGLWVADMVLDPYFTPRNYSIDAARTKEGQE
jgi:hypothetical protein